MSNLKQKFLDVPSLINELTLSGMACQSDDPSVVIVDEDGNEYRVKEVNDSLADVQVHVVKTYNSSPPKE